MGDHLTPEQQHQQQQQHAMQHHHHNYPHPQPVNIPAASLAPLVPPGAAVPTTATATMTARASTWQQQQQQQPQHQQPQYQYQQPRQPQQQTWQQQRWQPQQQQQQGPPGMARPPPPRYEQQQQQQQAFDPARQQQPYPQGPRGYRGGNGGGGGRWGPGPPPDRPGPGAGRGYGNGGRGNGNGGRGGAPPGRGGAARPPRWVATPAEPHDPPVAEAEPEPEPEPEADADASSAQKKKSAVAAFWLDPLPRSADDAAWRAARAALRASAALSPSPPQQAPDHLCVYVLRGLPGSGKSTRAAAIRALALSRGLECRVHSTDDLCVCPETGGYLFQAERLPELHDANHAAFEASLRERVPVVVVDNTNLVAWNYERYVAGAWRSGYRVREERVGEFSRAAAEGYARRNVHGVPRERIEQMLEGFLREERTGMAGRAPGGRAGW